MAIQEPKPVQGEGGPRYLLSVVHPLRDCQDRGHHIGMVEAEVHTRRGCLHDHLVPTALKVADEAEMYHNRVMDIQDWALGMGHHRYNRPLRGTVV